jgi:hypothetical protein
MSLFLERERERDGRGAGQNPARELAIGNQHTARRPALKRENRRVVAVEVEMRRRILLTAQDSADNRCLRLTPRVILRRTPRTSKQ